MSDTELQQGPVTEYHGDTSFDIYNKFSDYSATNRKSADNLELAIADSFTKKHLSLLLDNNKPDIFDTNHCFSSPANSISAPAFNTSFLDRTEDNVLYSSTSTTTTVLHIGNSEKEVQEDKELRPQFPVNDERNRINKCLQFEGEAERGLAEDESLLPLLPPTPDITPIGSPILSFPPSPSRISNEFPGKAQGIFENPSGGAEGPNPPYCEPSEYYGDEDAHNHLDTPLTVDVLQQAEAAAGNQPSPYLAELRSRGPMRHSAGSALSSSSYQAVSSSHRDKIYTPSSYSASSSYLRDRDLLGGGGSIYSYTGGRVPPTPPAHARPFSRSNSVPEQHYLHEFDPYDGLSQSSALNDYHTPFLGASDKDPLSWQSALSNSDSLSKYGASTSSLIGGHYRRQQRLNRLGKQLSLSSDLPTSAISDFPSSRGYNYLNDGYGSSRDRKRDTVLDGLGGISSSLSRSHLSRDRSSISNHPLHDAGTSLHTISGNSSIGKTALGVSTSSSNRRIHTRSSPLTLGKSLQLVTENFGSAAYNKEQANTSAVNKKTVRFNSEGSYNPIHGGSSFSSSTLLPFNTAPSIYGNISLNGTSSAVDGTRSSLFGNPSNPFADPSSSYHRYPHLHSNHSKHHLFEDFDICCEDAAWMTVEDVRSGRWARWDTQRQESQDSQTRDSGIETGSCFTSSEDSNRGGIVAGVGDHYHSRKVYKKNLTTIFKITTKQQQR